MRKSLRTFFRDPCKNPFPSVRPLVRPNGKWLELLTVRLVPLPHLARLAFRYLISDSGKSLHRLRLENEVERTDLLTRSIDGDEWLVGSLQPFFEGDQDNFAAQPDRALVDWFGRLGGDVARGSGAALLPASLVDPIPCRLIGNRSRCRIGLVVIRTRG